MQVKALRDCFVGDYRKEGEQFEYNGPKNENLEPVKAKKPEEAKSGDLAGE